MQLFYVPHVHKQTHVHYSMPTYISTHCITKSCSKVFVLGLAKTGTYVHTCYIVVLSQTGARYRLLIYSDRTLNKYKYTWLL